MTTTTAPPSSTPALGLGFWLAFGAILVGEVLDMLDSLVTVITGPSILRDLGGSDAALQWLSAGYTLALSAGVLVGGRLGDRFGRRRLFLLGMAGFVVTSTVAACAGSIEVLLVARVAAGVTFVASTGLVVLALVVGWLVLPRTAPQEGAAPTR